jgi:hypothetical protein
MIAAAKVMEVERLLADNRWSQRTIAKMVGVSRAVVGSIATGTRPDYEARRLARAEEDHEPAGPVGRCSGCGAKVYLPCRLCKVRAIKADEQQRARADRHRCRAVALRTLLWLLRNPPQRRENVDLPPEQRRAG